MGRGDIPMIQAAGIPFPGEILGFEPEEDGPGFIYDKQRQKE